MRLIFNGQEYFGPRGPAGPDGNPIGTVTSYLGRTPPRDYLTCDGGVYSISDYPELAAFFQRQFGSTNHFGGDGEATFAVPDMRNLFLRGHHGEAEETLSGEVGERQEGTELPYLAVDASYLGWYGANVALKNPDAKSEQKATYKRVSTVSSGSGSGATNCTVRPVNMAVLYCIKAVESFQAQDIYSTVEQAVGRWIDGKPIYRRVIDTTVPKTTGKWVPVERVDNVDKVIRLDTFVERTDSILPGNFSSYFYVSYLTKESSVGVYVNQTPAEYVGRPFHAVIEYTKTEEEAGDKL